MVEEEIDNGLCGTNAPKTLAGDIYFVVFILVVLGLFAFCIWRTIDDYNLRFTIKECNKDLGIGNWTFTETKDVMTCQAYHKDSFESSHSSYSCYVKNKEVNCSDIEYS